jgi:hypothetical protein
MPIKVLLTNGAAHDLDELYDCIALQDAPRKADYVDMQSLLQRRLFEA